MTTPRPRYAPGSKVRLLTNEDGTVTTEYGIVLCSWWNEDLQDFDYYIGFRSPPDNDIVDQPPKPYVLRYAEMSLRRGWHPPDPYLASLINKDTGAFYALVLPADDLTPCADPKVEGTFERGGKTFELRICDPRPTYYVSVDASDMPLFRDVLWPGETLE